MFFPDGIFLVLPFVKPFQALIYHCHLHPLQAANCCRNSRLVVNEDDYDYDYDQNEKNILQLLKQFHENFPLCVGN